MMVKIHHAPYPLRKSQINPVQKKFVKTPLSCSGIPIASLPDFMVFIRKVILWPRLRMVWSPFFVFFNIFGGITVDLVPVCTGYYRHWRYGEVFVDFIERGSRTCTPGWNDCRPDLHCLVKSSHSRIKQSVKERKQLTIGSGKIGRSTNQQTVARSKKWSSFVYNIAEYTSGSSTTFPTTDAASDILVAYIHTMSVYPT